MEGGCHRVVEVSLRMEDENRRAVEGRSRQVGRSREVDHMVLAGREDKTYSVTEGIKKTS